MSVELFRFLDDALIGDIVIGLHYREDYCAGILDVCVDKIMYILHIGICLILIRYGYKTGKIDDREVKPNRSRDSDPKNI